MAHFTRRFDDDSSYMEEEVLRKVAQAEKMMPRVMAGRGQRSWPPQEQSYDQEYYDDSYSRQPPPNDSYSRQPPPRARDFVPRPPPRDVTCGELRSQDAGSLVHMRGRVQFQRLNRFVFLRDSCGTTQLVAPEDRFDLMKRIRKIPIDSHLEIVGKVERRPQHTINNSMPTGEIEVVIEDILDVAASKRKMYEPVEEESSSKKSRSSILITSSEISRCETPAMQRKFNQRTHNCGDLNKVKPGDPEVSLCGWLDSKRNDRFAILRDGYGAAQIVINTSDLLTVRTMQKAEEGTVITVRGRVSQRPAHQCNTRMPTGNIEVKVTFMEIVDSTEQDLVDDKATEKMEVQESGSSLLPSGGVNSYSSRTHTCGQLRGSDVGMEVMLCGWLDSQRGSRFATIRDGHGSTQLLVPTQLENTVGKLMAGSSLESVIMVVGTVAARPPEQVTEKTETGEVEVVVKEYSVLNSAKSDLPFIIREHNRPKESLRMKYRYLDLRFSDMQKRLRLRSKVLLCMRQFLIDQRGFVEVETPTLFRRTPGGAQEYVVPTRSPDKFYSLVQSPQQLKQLLMVGAMDRYFQVARCYRDEGARPDRQPEFTQMDIELSFTDATSIMALIEDLLKASWPEDLLKPLVTPFQVISYHDAMHCYGTDKPNLSFDNKLVDISELLTEEAKATLPQELTKVKNFTMKALVFGQNVGKKLEDSFEECEKLQKKDAKSKSKLILVKCSAKGWKLPLNQSVPFVDADKLKEFLDLPSPCSIVIGYGKDTDVLPLMGKLRQDVFARSTTSFHFAWIVDFPLFVEDEDGSLASSHHPFTQPRPEDLHLLLSDPLQVRGQHFDLVLNGFEVGGGSVRIHDADLQTQVLKDILNIPTDSMQHLLEALRSGAPPHGGIALGMDRLMSIMVGAESIRDVIAFPKGVDGKDPLSGAPCPISHEEKKMYHLVP